jgi:hypothetical protein
MIALAPCFSSRLRALNPLRLRGLDRWLLPYLRDWRQRRVSTEAPVHLLICIADHYEPSWGNPPAHQAMLRVERWVRDYPRLFQGFADSDGRPPRHSFFFPLEQYQYDQVERLADLCRAGFGEVEVHLHHDHDTPAGLRQRLLDFKNVLANEHGLLSRDNLTGEIQYGFIHGNWALDNSRPDGRWCGVNNEIDILIETGCYADFTLPSAPSPTQTCKINRIYYAVDDPVRPKSHDTGVDVGTAPQPHNSLLLIQGPLLLDWTQRKWGLVPRIENGCIQAGQSPTRQRLDLWRRANIHVPTRPDWVFVKLHTHGAKESIMDVLLGEPMVRFHRALAATARQQPGFHFHYVTAREMANLVHAAEAGWQGDVAAARDYRLAASNHPSTCLISNP